MSIIDRLILSIYTFCLAVISLLAILTAVNVIPGSSLNTYINLISENSDAGKITVVIAALFFLVSVKYLFSGLGKAKSKDAIKKTSQLGSILITLNSIENIIMSVVKQMDGVMDVKIDLENKKDNVEVKLNIVVTPERSIPELSAIIQSKAKEAVESIAGVGVSFVEVLVQDVIQTIKPTVKSRVE